MRISDDKDDIAEKNCHKNESKRTNGFRSFV